MKKKILLLFLLLVIPFITINATGDNMPILGSPNSNEDTSLVENGSVFLAGTEVSSEKDVRGLLFAAGNNINVNANNDYGLYAGNTINIKSKINNDLFVAGNYITIADTAYISRDAYIAGNQININANIERNLKVAASTINFNNTIINGDVYVDAGTIIFGSNVTINGELRYNDSAVIKDIANAYVAKTSTYVDNTKDYEAPKKTASSVVISTVSLILVSLVVFAIFPKLYKAVTDKVVIMDVVKNIGAGFLTLIATPIGALILMITGIGLGIGLLSLGLYILFIATSMIIPSAIVGNLIVTKLFKLKDKMYLSVLLGVIVVKLVKLIPCVGGWIGFLIILTGLGYAIKLMFTKKA